MTAARDWELLFWRSSSSDKLTRNSDFLQLIVGKLCSAFSNPPRSILPWLHGVDFGVEMVSTTVLNGNNTAPLGSSTAAQTSQNEQLA
jgi:hypothetical protein